MRPRELTLKDRTLFQRYLSLREHWLSSYAFQNIYIWKKLFAIHWAIIEDSLYVFFRDKHSCFLYLPPMGKSLSASGLKKAFSIMDNFNQNREVSRVENVEEQEVAVYRSLGYQVFLKSCDYLCRRQDLALLKGNAFKSKRACVNYFLKHYTFDYRPFTEKDKSACLKLYGRWMGQRKNYLDSIYRGMLADNLEALKILLRVYRDLAYLGRVVEVAGEIKAFTFGFKLNQDTFCILYEVTDLAIKGVAQFIFREFSAELRGYRHINIMDDSGLENLKAVKLSYRPTKLIPAYIARR